MDRFSGANYATVGGLRMFQDENLGTGVDGSYPNALWFNGAQESLLGPVTKTGQAPSDGDNLQLYKAIRAISARSITSITANATLTMLGAGLILVSAAAGNVVLTLPASNTGADFLTEFRIVRTDLSANTVTVALAGGDTWITGGSTPIAVPYGSPVPIVNDGISHWAYLGASGSFGATGWKNYGDSIIQWGGFSGTVGATDANGIAENATVPIVFPVAFNVACWRVYLAALDVSGAGQQESAWGSGAATVTGATVGVSCRTGFATVNANFIAIGR